MDLKYALFLIKKPNRLTYNSLVIILEIFAANLKKIKSKHIHVRHVHITILMYKIVEVITQNT